MLTWYVSVTHGMSIHFILHHEGSRMKSVHWLEVLHNCINTVVTASSAVVQHIICTCVTTCSMLRTQIQALQLGVQ